MQKVMDRYGITVPDPQLACVPVDSDEGRHYLAALAAALCYLGVFAGYEHTCDDMQDPMLVEFVRRMLLESRDGILARAGWPRTLVSGEASAS
jgi:hypothetical protein